MLTIRLRHRDHSTLFSGDYRTTYEAIEDALQQGCNLDGADFSYLDLREINLDGAELRGVNFTGSNLTGANLSEASLSQSCFDQASLYNACLCYSDLSECSFRETYCGGTDVAGAILRGCVFSGTSILTLNLHESAGMSGASFITENSSCPMTEAPVTMHGLKQPITILDTDILIGTAHYHIESESWKAVAGTLMPPADVHRAITMVRQLRQKF